MLKRKLKIYVAIWSIIGIIIVIKSLIEYGAQIFHEIFIVAFSIGISIIFILFIFGVICKFIKRLFR